MMHWTAPTMFALALLIASCAAPPAPPPPPPAKLGDPSLAGAVHDMLVDLRQQVGAQAQLPRTAVVDTFLDGRSAQQTTASERAQQEFVQALPGVLPQVQVLRFDEDGARQSRWVVTGTLSAANDAGAADGAAVPGRWRLVVALADRPSGLVVAQAVARVDDAALQAAPTRFYADSPALVRDRTVDGFLRTTETPAGQPADAVYLEQLPTGALLAGALEAYNAKRWDEAHRYYEAAAQRRDGHQMRTFNGLYLASLQLGRQSEAEAAFGHITALGLATNNLAVKLLFRPGSTDFWPDPQISGHYPMWIRQIARSARSADTCLDIVGHTSRTGSVAYNDRLSLARADSMRERLDNEAPGLARRIATHGVGWRENLVGSGTDDARDAVDRRVEFRVVPCR